MPIRRFPFAAAVLVAAVAPAPAQTDVSVPGFSSRAGAAYTLYLDFGGFSFTGNWGANNSSPNSGGFGTPGFTPAYGVDGDSGSFSQAELRNIQEVWSRVAEKYAAVDVNVTTVDPAVAAGRAGSDAQRQAYYDSQAGTMHTVIGGTGSWYGAAGGVSFTGLLQYSSAQAPYNGVHNNWVFPESTRGASSFLPFVAEAAAHENGHAFGLLHHSVGSGSSYQEYDPGTGTGAGSKAPILGDSYYAERGLFMVGQYNANNDKTTRAGNPNYQTQNDLQVILGNPGLTVVNDGVGKTRATATAIQFQGTTIDAAANKGVIVPADPTDPTKLATAATVTPTALTSDFFSFHVASESLLSLTLNAGRSTLTAGTPDPGATLDGAFELLDAAGTVIYTRNTAALSETLTAADLAAGDYYVRVFAPADADGYYNMGSYYLSGSLAPVPEPAGVLAAAAAGYGVLRRVRRRAAGQLAA